MIKSVQDYQHRENVLNQGGVSLENYEHAVAALRASVFSLQMTEVLYSKALAIVQGTTLYNHPKIIAAADTLKDGWLRLYRCNIYAPSDGLVAQRTIQVGMWIPAGQPLLNIIPLDQIWVNANFKETQLKKMRIGQSVKIHSDLYGWNTVFHGKVVGIPGGAGNAFSLLPPQNLSGNWIKIVQRLPVRVALDPEELKEHPLRIGLSIEATVDLRDQEGLLVPTTSLGSPTYQTSIFQKEEIGLNQVIQEVIAANIDPSLLLYTKEPIEMR